MHTEPNAVEACELALYAVNDGDLYRQRALPILKNLARKRIKGSYDAELAVKAWQYLADDAATKYRREFSMVGGFDKPTRLAAARRIASHYDEALDYHTARIRKLDSIWKKMHRDYKGCLNGERCVMVWDAIAGTILTPLETLTDDQIAGLV